MIERPPGVEFEEVLRVGAQRVIYGADPLGEDVWVDSLKGGCWEPTDPDRRTWRAVAARLAAEILRLRSQIAAYRNPVTGQPKEPPK